MTPLLASISAVVTLASATFTPPVVSINTGEPSSVTITCSSFRSPDITAAPATTWYLSTSASSALLNLPSTPGFFASKASNAASDGANTVNGPLPLSASTRPAWPSAAASFVKLPAATAVSTMSFAAVWPAAPAPALPLLPAAASLLPESSLQPITPLATTNIMLIHGRYFMRNSLPKPKAPSARDRNGPLTGESLGRQLVAARPAAD